MDDLMLSLFVCLIIPMAMSLLVLSGKSRQLFIFFLSGIFMCLFAGQINGLAALESGLDTYTLTTTITPVVEEIVKIIPVLILAFILQADRQTLLECALMVGLGFATMENVYILISNASEVSFVWALSRGAGSAMLHAVTSLIVAYGISFCTVRKKTFITGTYAMLLEAMVFHGIYNMLVQSDKFMHFGLVLPTIVFVPLAVRIFKQRKN
ncbi:MAG: PrsW family glutamic-type intramembrane protease [Bacillota bacterium]|nr:PrsW family glutamic-type intramembrane protease [Bacillota bacterium]